MLYSVLTYLNVRTGWVLAFILFGMTAAAVPSDSLWVEGTIMNEQKEYLVGVNVFVQGQERRAVQSNGAGFFRLRVAVEDTAASVIFQYVFDNMLPLKMKAAQLIHAPRSVILKKNHELMAELVIKTKQPISAQFTTKKLESLDVYGIPLSQGDPLRAIAALPYGTNTDESANVSLRGSSAERSNVILNGVPIYRPVRNTSINGIGNFSLFNTRVIGREYIYPSAPPLTYGNTSAGLIAIETKKELKYNDYALSLGLANVGFFIDQKITDKHFIQTYGNIQFSKPFLNIHRNSMAFLKDFGNKDWGVNIHSVLSKRVTLNFFNYIISEHFQAEIPFLNYQGIQTARSFRNFSIFNLDYKIKSWQFTANVRADINNNNIEYGNISGQTRNQNYYFSLNARYGFRNNSLQAGFTMEQPLIRTVALAPVHFSFAPGDTAQIRRLFLKNPIYELYVFDKYEIIPEKLMFSIGLRKNIPAPGQPSYWSGQVLAKYDFFKYHSVNVHYGYYHNFAEPDVFLPVFRLLSARQGSIDYAFNYKKYVLTASVFHKYEQGPGSVFLTTTASEQRIFGMEASLTVPIITRLIFNVSYSYLNTDFILEDRKYRGNNDFPYFIRSYLSYYHAKRGTLSVSYVGRPGVYYTPIYGAFRLPDTDIYQPFFGDYNSAQLNGYHNISLQYNYMRSFKNKRGGILFFVNVVNVLDRKNQSHAYYTEDYMRILSYFYLSRVTFYTGIVVNYTK